MAFMAKGMISRSSNGEHETKTISFYEQLGASCAVYFFSPESGARLVSDN